MRHSALVSVIIPFFNAAQFLDAAIASVVAQSHPHWELLLIDDGSTDDSSEIARRYERELKGQARYLEHDGHRNRGLSASRNVGLQHARGDYIALLDADDVWLPTKLERQVDLLEANPDAALIYGRSEYWSSWNSADGSAADHVPDLGAHIPLDTVIRPPTLLVLNYPLGQCAAPPPSDLMFRSGLMARIGGFEEQFRGNHQMYEDQAFLTKCYLSENVYVSSECWDRYRQHPLSLGAVGAREGHYPAVRQYFLEWLRTHLLDRAVHDPDVWQALYLALWPYLPVAERRAAEAALRDAATPACSDAGDLEQLEGVHDVASCETISGWVWNRGQPTASLVVEVYDDATLLLTLPATRFRRDLLAAGKGDGCHAFTCRLPPWLRDGRTHRIWVKTAGSGIPLASTPHTITCPPV